MRLPRRPTLARKGQKESPVQAIARAIRRGEHGEIPMKEAADQDPLIAAESDYVLKDFRFSDGGSLPELKLHYRTMGQPARHPVTGEVQNAVLLIATTGFQIPDYAFSSPTDLSIASALDTSHATGFSTAMDLTTPFSA